MERCPNCGVETRPGDQFCLNCGNRLAVSQPAANQWGGQPAPAAPPPSPGPPWFGGPNVPPSMPTGPTWQAVNPGTGPAVDDPTVVTPQETLEPTMRAPDPPPMAFGAPPVGLGADLSMEEAPETLAPTAFAPPPPVEPAPGFSGNLVTQTGDAEAAEVTVTMIDEAPAKLIVTRNGQAREFLLKKPDITIGRAPSNDVALSGDQLASRRHALIRFDGVNFIIRDVGSANGTYINGVELRAPTPLRNGDHVGVGEHEIVFFLLSEMEEAEPPTVTIPPPEQTGGVFETVAVPGQADTLEPSSPWATRGDSGTMAAREEAFIEMDEEIVVDEEVGISTGPDLPTNLAEEPEEALQTITAPPPTAFPQPAPSPFEPMDAVASQVAVPMPEMPEATIIERIEITEESRAAVSVEDEEEDAEIPEPVAPVDRFYVEPVNEEDMPLPVPQLPEIPTMLSAIKSLDETTAEMRENLRQAKALEEQAQQLREQLRVASDLISNHDNSVAALAQRLRVGVADVSNRLNKVIEEVTRADESLSIAELEKLIEDVRNDPRDIYTLGSLARRARELAQFFEMHQHVNQILSECLTTLNGLLSADMATPEGQE